MWLPSLLSACGDVSVQGYLVARPADASEILAIAGRMGPRMRALLEAAEGGRVHGADDDSDGTVLRLRRRGAGGTVRSDLLA